MICTVIVQAVLVNSSWTANHIAQLFIVWRRPKIVYPPCDTSSFQVTPLIHMHYLLRCCSVKGDCVSSYWMISIWNCNSARSPGYIYN